MAERCYCGNRAGWVLKWPETWTLVCMQHHLRAMASDNPPDSAEPLTPHEWNQQPACGQGEMFPDA